MTMCFTHRRHEAAAVLDVALAETSSIPHATPYATYLSERNQHACSQMREVIGERVLTLLGANALRYSSDSETPYFAFAIRGSVKCDHLRIEMLDDDLYTVIAFRQEKALYGTPSLHQVDHRDDVPAHLLLPVLERMTDVTLPTA